MGSLGDSDRWKSTPSQQIDFKSFRRKPLSNLRVRRATSPLWRTDDQLSTEKSWMVSSAMSTLFLFFIFFEIENYEILKGHRHVSGKLGTSLYCGLWGLGLGLGLWVHPELTKFKIQNSKKFSIIRYLLTVHTGGRIRAELTVVPYLKRSSFWTLSHRIASLIFIASRLRNKLATVLLSITDAVVQGYFSRPSDIAESPFSVLADGVDSTESGRTFHCKHHVDSLP